MYLIVKTHIERVKIAIIYSPSTLSSRYSRETIKTRTEMLMLKLDSQPKTSKIRKVSLEMARV